MNIHNASAIFNTEKFPILFDNFEKRYAPGIAII